MSLNVRFSYFIVEHSIKFCNASAKRSATLIKYFLRCRVFWTKNVRSKPQIRKFLEPCFLFLLKQLLATTTLVAMLENANRMTAVGNVYAQRTRLATDSVATVCFLPPCTKSIPKTQGVSWKTKVKSVFGKVGKYCLNIVRQTEQGRGVTACFEDIWVIQARMTIYIYIRVCCFGILFII